jgi:STE24 endopeptidase
MELNIYLYLIVFIVTADFIFDQWLDYLNKKAWTNTVPDALADVYPTDKFEKHKLYRSANYRFGIVNHLFSFVLLMSVLLMGGFSLADGWAAAMSINPIWRALIFFAIIGIVSTVINIPFSWYDTFVIEAKFGFNKTTPKIFWTDLLKSLLLGALIGGPLMAALIWFYTALGDWFWLAAWGLVAFFTVFMAMFYTTLLLPLFNKQTPLPEGELRQAIEAMGQRAGFKIDNIVVMDGSKRSTKANAFFSGFGPKKRIVLYDTLINDLSVDEITAVLAHEIGHYKLKHILWGTLIGIAQTGAILFVFSKVVSAPQLSMALGVETPQFHIGLITFGILFTPISMVLGLVGSWLSRQNEYAADAFAAKHADGIYLVSALKKISANALSNVTPHPVYVFFHYSHPPLLDRIGEIEKVQI